MLKVFALLALYSPSPTSDTADVFRGLVVPFLLALSGGSSGPPLFLAEWRTGQQYGVFGQEGEASRSFWISVCVCLQKYLCFWHLIYVFAAAHLSARWQNEPEENEWSLIGLKFCELKSKINYSGSVRHPVLLFICKYWSFVYTCLTYKVKKWPLMLPSSLYRYL